MSSPLLAGPPGDCCFKGVKHAGDPAGRSIEIAGVPTYISEPPSQLTNEPKKIILYLSDIFGPFFLNNQLIQDYFAGHGFLVLGIDYFFGDAIHLHLEEERFDRAAWIANGRLKSREVYPKWLETVRSIYGIKLMDPSRWSPAGERRIFSLRRKRHIISQYFLESRTDLLLEETLRSRMNVSYKIA
ncbi:hypothetical protein H0H87_005745 [Tephrocybe sp. NHM501043]|nr:hypothetical protein H0H87_005745 [Tephrocybe sp. NHM501043]